MFFVWSNFEIVNDVHSSLHGQCQWLFSRSSGCIWLHRLADSLWTESLAIPSRCGKSLIDRWLSCDISSFFHNFRTRKSPALIPSSTQAFLTPYKVYLVKPEVCWYFLIQEVMSYPCHILPKMLAAQGSAWSLRRASAVSQEFQETHLPNLSALVW